MAVLAWMRVLRVTLTQQTGTNGKAQQITFGSNEERNLTVESPYDSSRRIADSDLAISVSGDKFMSTLKDCCTIKLKNLTYAEIVRIITGEFYNIKIECGYRSANEFTIFEGGVMYISNLRESMDTNTVTILAASYMIARYGQRRLNLSFSSGVNLYSAINFVCKVGGIPNPNLSTQLKKDFNDAVQTYKNKSAADIIADIADSNGTFISNSDCVGNSFLQAFDASKTNARVIKLNADTIVLANGYPRMTTDGVSFSVLPTFQFQCGDTIVVDNSLIQIDVQSQRDATKNLGGLLDENGQYMIFEQHYELNNRDNNFYLQLKCKTRSRVSAYITEGL